MIATAIATMQKYLRIYVSFIRVGFIADLEYRANFIFRVITDIVWYAAQILSFRVLFNHTGRIGGWDFQQTQVFLGVLFFTDAIYMITLNENLDKLTDRVRKGELDLLLAKPINSQFMVSLQKVSTSLIANLGISTTYLIYALCDMPVGAIHPLQILWLLLLVPCGLLNFYAVRFFIATLSVIFTKSDNLQYVWYQAYRLGLRPDGIYPLWLKLIVRSILPVALIAAVPARFVLFDFDPLLFAWMIVWTAFLLWGSSRFWKFALSRYSSASS